MSNWKHWIIRRDERGIAWITIDRANESTNALSGEVMRELATVLDALDQDPPKAAIFRSGKSAGFIAGADIKEFGSLATREGAHELLSRGWTLFNRLAEVRYPTLALVRGHCLGGGLELALACRYLMAVDDPSTKMALPEVMLGIVPGWGGMLRLPERVGPSVALDMMLTGKTVDAKKAKRIGLADFLVPPRLMDKSAADYVLSGKPRRKLPFADRLMAGPLRGYVAKKAGEQVAKKARAEHYPAPYVILDTWAKHKGNALADPSLLERIVEKPTAKNLVRVFHLQERLKAFGKETDGGSRPITRVHVVGAGVMGGDIAAWCALRGLTATLQDLDIDRIAPAIGRAKKLFDRKLRGDKLRVRDAMDRLIPDPAGDGAVHADVVIEAIVENLEIKQKLFAELEAKMRPDAVLASNTSSLKLADLQAGMKHPERLVGIHFFNPVAMMPLVEVVEAAGTDEAMLRQACAFVKQIDKLPLPVKDAPGFLVNAVLGPYMHEAMRCVDEGIAPEVVDAAMVAFGMPMGPIELVDMVGLDIAVHAGKQLAGDGVVPPKCLLTRVEKNQLGRKSGQGFYAWPNGKVQKAAAGAVPEGLADRLLAPFLAKTQQLVADGVVADAELADAGVIFGTGFAPFTGGPLHYLDHKVTA